jgi:membrane-bound serine protease (ClpP class)
VRRLAIALIAAPLIVATGSALAGGFGSATAGASNMSPDTTVPATTAVTVTTVAGGATSVTTAATTTPVDASLAPVDVLQVSGLFDGVVVNAIERAIDRAAAKGSQALILQVDSEGAVVPDERIARLVQRVATAPIPIGIWIGPSGDARLYGTPAQLMAVADVTAMVSGSRFGYTGLPFTISTGKVGFGAATDRLRDGSLSFGEARTFNALKLDTPDVGVPTIRSMVLAMDGVTVDGKTLHTVTRTVTDKGVAQVSATLVRFSKIGLVEQLIHTVSSPPVAYLLFIVGLALLIFEFFTAGVGVGGVVGAVCTFLGIVGFANLPVRGWAVALLVVAMVGFAIDVQVGIPRFWTGFGLVTSGVASWFLFRDVRGGDLRLGWITLVVGLIGLALAFVVGMPSMVRTRFATPTIGREWMIGMTGTAVADVDPDGIVTVADARWRARTNRATPVKAGDTVKVVSIDGVTLEIEPETGGARDHRERRAPANQG